MEWTTGLQNVTTMARYSCDGCSISAIAEVLLLLCEALPSTSSTSTGLRYLYLTSHRRLSRSELLSLRFNIPCFTSRQPLRLRPLFSTLLFAYMLFGSIVLFSSVILRIFPFKMSELCYVSLYASFTDTLAGQQNIASCLQRGRSSVLRMTSRGWILAPQSAKLIAHPRL